MTETKTSSKKKQKNRKKNNHTFLKVVLSIIGLLVLGVGVFVCAVKFMQPDFDFKTLIPKEVASFVSGEVKEEITTEIAQSTTEPTTVKNELFYLEQADFKFEAKKVGSYMGNILKGGMVERDNGYVYHIVQGSGIYRFKADTEAYEKVYKTSDNINNLNILGDYLYFIDNNVLCRVKKGTSTKEELLEGAKTAYIYGDNAYTTGDQGEIDIYSISKSTVIFTDSYYDTIVKIVGISLNGVFFTSTDNSNVTKYYYADLDTHETVEFMEQTTNDKVLSMCIENGFMYYYQRQMDNTYDLIRQKIGSQNQVTLVEETTCQQPVTVSKNLVFYSNFEDNQYQVKEYNMNSNVTKTMLSASGVADVDDVIFQNGGEYDFIIGKKENGDKIYMASSNLTGSTNVMKFKDGKWKY